MTGDSVETFPETEVGSGKEQRKLKGGAEKLGAKWVLWWWPIFTCPPHGLVVVVVETLSRSFKDMHVQCTYTPISRCMHAYAYLIYTLFY